MRQTYWQTEQERLNALADEYVAAGYDVLIHPQSDQLPTFLKGLEPDLVASKGEDNVVVEVRSRAMLKDKALVPLVQAVEGRPGWRVELVVANPPNVDVFGDTYQTLDTRQLGQILDQAEAIREKDPRYAAFLTWVALEGVLVRQLAQAEGTLPNRAPKRLVKEAISLGLVEPEAWVPLERLAEFRNRFVHAMVADAPTVEDIETADTVTRHLLSHSVVR